MVASTSPRGCPEPIRHLQDTHLSFRPCYVLLDQHGHQTRALLRKPILSPPLIFHLLSYSHPCPVLCPISFSSSCLASNPFPTLFSNLFLSYTYSLYSLPFFPSFILSHPLFSTSVILQFPPVSPTSLPLLCPEGEEEHDLVLF